MSLVTVSRMGRNDRAAQTTLEGLLYFVTEFSGTKLFRTSLGEVWLTTCMVGIIDTVHNCKRCHSVPNVTG